MKKYNKYNITINGRFYPSVQLAADELGLKKGTLLKRIRSSNYSYKDVVDDKQVIITVFQ